MIATLRPQVFAVLETVIAEYLNDSFSEIVAKQLDRKLKFMLLNTILEH
jgi:hypothetical protein